MMEERKLCNRLKKRVPAILAGEYLPLFTSPPKACTRPYMAPSLCCQAHQGLCLNKRGSREPHEAPSLHCHAGQGFFPLPTTIESFTWLPAFAVGPNGTSCPPHWCCWWAMQAFCLPHMALDNWCWVLQCHMGVMHCSWPLQPQGCRWCPPHHCSFHCCHLTTLLGLGDCKLPKVLLNLLVFCKPEFAELFLVTISLIHRFKYLQISLHLIIIV